MSETKPQDFFNACIDGDMTIVEQFIHEKNYPIDLKNEKGWTGLVMACFNENRAIAKFLIKNGANINATNHKGTTIFMYAKTPIQQKQTDTSFLKYLLDNGADINALDHKGLSVLDYVSQNGYHILAEWLRTQGAKESSAL